MSESQIFAGYKIFSPAAVTPMSDVLQARPADSRPDFCWSVREMMRLIKAGTLSMSHLISRKDPVDLVFSKIYESDFRRAQRLGDLFKFYNLERRIKIQHLDERPNDTENVLAAEFWVLECMPSSASPEWEKVSRALKTVSEFPELFGALPDEKYNLDQIAAAVKVAGAKKTLETVYWVM